MKNRENPGTGHQKRWETRIPGSRNRICIVPGAKTRVPGTFGKGPQFNLSGTWRRPVGLVVADIDKEAGERSSWRGCHKSCPAGLCRSC